MEDCALIVMSAGIRYVLLGNEGKMMVKIIIPAPILWVFLNRKPHGHESISKDKNFIQYLLSTICALSSIKSSLTDDSGKRSKKVDALST